jgi:lysozyme family protein
MSARDDSAIAKVLEFEGGVSDVGDGKGVTRYGQTPGWLEDNGFVPPTSAGDAAINYELWMVKTRIAEVAELSPTLGFLLADFAVHSGERQAVKQLQKALGFGLDLQDGILGPRTLAEVKRYIGMGSDVELRLARNYWRARLTFIGELLGSMKTDRRRFARGWISRLAQIDATLV